MSISNNLMLARLAKDLTQAELAMKVGVSKNAISNYENGVSTPKIEILLALMDALDVDANYVYGIQPHDHLTMSLNDRERSVILAYRQHPEMQAAVDTLLHLPAEDFKTKNA